METYINPAVGDDENNDGTEGSPYQTLARAVEDIPFTVLSEPFDIHLADGVYDEPVWLGNHLGSRENRITLIGNVTYPGDVRFKGAIATELPVLRSPGTAVGWIDGRFHVAIRGVTFMAEDSQNYGLLITDGATCVVDSCNVRRDTGSYDRGALGVVGRASVEFEGNVYLAGWTNRGLWITRQSMASCPSGPGSLVVEGPQAGNGNGIVIGYHSSFTAINDVYSIDVSGVRYAFQLGLSGKFQHIGAGGTISCHNALKPTNSAAVQGTDHSSWSTNRPVVFSNFSYGIDLNSLSYGEAVGLRTMTNITQNSRVAQNSVAYLP